MKSWNTTRTGMVFHSFKTDGTAVCRGNIRHAEGTELFTEEQIDARLAEAWGARVRGFRKCDSCSGLEAKAAARAEASMQPSTGEGDHLPPAEEERCCDHASSHHGGRGCDECPCATPRTGAQQDAGKPAPAVPQPSTNEEDSLPINSGPLTERQITIIGHVRAGLRYRKVAEQLGISEVLVRQEVVTINRKLRAATLQQAIGIYATAQAYREVANALDYASRAHPEQDGVAEDHVNHVLMALAAVYRDRAAKLLPQ